MSVEKETILKPPSKIKTAFTIIKILLVSIIIFFIIMAGTVGILYLTNNSAKSMVDSQIKQYKARKEKQKQEQTKNASDSRIPELAKYYLQMSETDLAHKMIDIRKADKKSYEKILSSMMIMNPQKTSNMNKMMEKIESKKDIISQEYDNMVSSKQEENKKTSSYYASLGVKGAIDAIQNELQNSMDYAKVSSALELSQPKFVAKVLHYINPMYVEGIRNRFNNEFNKIIDKELQIYSEFIRKNSSLSSIYENTKEEIAAKKLQDVKKFDDEALAVIFSNMDYLASARILSNFDDESRVQDILSEIRKIEDFNLQIDGSYSKIVANSIKVIKKYSEDVDILKRAYEKMQPEDLAGVIDRLVTSNPIYKTYKIDNTRKFSISERKMAIDSLKRIKPAIVGQVITQLKNDDKLDKATYLSRELGMPEP